MDNTQHTITQTDAAEQKAGQQAFKRKALEAVLLQGVQSKSK